MRKTHIVRGTALLAGAALCILLIGQGSADWWGTLGRKAAKLSVGMQQPAGGAMVLSEQVQAALAQVTPTTTVPVTTATTRGTTTATTTKPTAALPAMTTPIPQKAANAGVVLTQLLTTGNDFVQGVAVRNRSGKAFDIARELAKGTEVVLRKNTSEPQVLIVHTHTTENYLTYDAGFYNPADVERTKDMSRNICAAGAAVAAALNEAGVATVHDTTIHDNPQYTGAYTRSEKTVKALLQKYPSVKVVLDVHRDAILPSDTTHVKPTATVNGKKAAQMMIIAGVVSTDALPHPNWQKNFSFALQLQKKLANAYPDLMRPLYIVASRYNQHLSPGYLLVEIGSDVNTVQEAVYSGRLLGKTIAEFLEK